MVDATLKDLRISHARYDAALAEVRDAINLSGHRGTCIPLLGPTRVGKSDLIDAIYREFATEKPGPGYMLPTPDFVRDTIRPKPSDSEIYSSILRAMGARVSPNTKFAVLQDRVQDMLHQRGVRIVALDECSHCAEPGANLSKRAAADHIKTIIDQSGVIMILTGLPTFQRLVDENEQLSERSMSTVYLLPYHWADPDDRSEFVNVVYSILGHLKDLGVHMDFDPIDISRRLYAATGGRVGRVVELIEAALKCRAKAAALSRDDLAKAAGVRLQKAKDMPPIFGPEVPQDSVLFRSYAKVMRAARLRLPDPTTATELDAFNQVTGKASAA